MDAEALESSTHGSVGKTTLIFVLALLAVGSTGIANVVVFTCGGTRGGETVPVTEPLTLESLWAFEYSTTTVKLHT